TKLRFTDCMLYGSFEPSTGERYLPCAAVNFDNCSFGAYPGIMFSIINCDNVTIKNLNLDGNADNFSIGGYFSAAHDGIQLPFDGIVLSNSSVINIEYVNSHHFGRDGLMLAPGALVSDIGLNLVNSKFNHNRRTGFAW